jgi:hypothetical protein
MHCASDTNSLFVTKIPYLIKVAYPNSDLVLNLNEWVSLLQLHLLVLKILLVSPGVVHTNSLMHELLNTVDAVIIEGLGLLRGLIHCELV